MDLASMGGWIASIIVAGIGGFTTYLVAKANRKGTSENLLIDQYQEDNASLRTELALANNKIEKQESRERVLIDYVYKLHQHIMEGKAPPPPEFPRELLNL